MSAGNDAGSQIPDVGERPPGSSPTRTILVVFLPFALFSVIAIFFYTQLIAGTDPSTIPSALIDKPAPDFKLPALEGVEIDGQPVPGFARSDLKDQVTLVNVWASWCGPCRTEHPILMQLAKDDRFKLTGINYKDKPANARRFLGSLGNPYAAIGVDATGRTGIDWGVYGVPETFVVDRFGCIAFKFIGPLHQAGVENNLFPAIEKAAKRDAPPTSCEKVPS